MSMKSIAKNTLLIVFLFMIYMFIPVVLLINTGNFIELTLGIDKAEIAYLPMWSFLFSLLYLYSAQNLLSSQRERRERKKAQNS